MTATAGPIVSHAANSMTQSGLRARDQAHALGLSEGELVASSLDAETVRLRPAWRELLLRLPEVGRVMCLTRNEHAVHERHGRFDNVSANGPHGLVLGPDIDLRIFFSGWVSGFAVTQALPSGRRRSLQFFDRHGTAVHKIYVTDETDRDAFERIVGEFRALEQAPGLAVEAIRTRHADRPDGEVDRAALRASWNAMRDTHDFVGILAAHKVGRVQALRLAGNDFAQPVSRAALRQMLVAASTTSLPIMVFVGNPGCIQIHTGTVHRIEPRGPWLNVLDPLFNLHLREDAIAHAFVVRKPTDDGVVTSLELFDCGGDNIALLFGARKPGKPELEAWRDLAAGLA